MARKLHIPRCLASPLRITAALAAGIVFLLPAAGVQARDFALFTFAYLDDQRTPSLRVVTEVSYTSLVFFKHDEGYRADFEVRVAIADRKKDKVVRTAVIHGDAVADTYEETTLRKNKNRRSRTFALGPGEYKIEATLSVKNTHIMSRRTSVVVVPDFLATGIGFGTPVVMSVPRHMVKPMTSWREFNADEPPAAEMVDHTLSIFDEQPAVRVAIYLEEKPSTTVGCDVYYEVLDVTKKITAYGKKKLQLRGSQDEFVVSFNVDEWEPGPYTANFRAVTEGTGREATASVVFNVDITRAMLGVFFNETIGMLSLIADGNDLKGLRDAREEDRPAEWSKFWSERDPDPGTPQNEALEEYLTRVRMVSEMFSGVQPGWRTDRGRIYIQYGAPERVQRISDPQYRGEYEIWRYYTLNRTFVFYDMFGLGDFRLIEGDIF